MMCCLESLLICFSPFLFEQLLFLIRELSLIMWLLVLWAEFLIDLDSQIQVVTEKEGRQVKSRDSQKQYYLIAMI